MKRSAIHVRDGGQMFALEPDRPYSFVGAFCSPYHGATLVCLQIVRTGFNVDLPSEGSECFMMNPNDARNLARQLQIAADQAGSDSKAAQSASRNEPPA